MVQEWPKGAREERRGQGVQEGWEDGKRARQEGCVCEQVRGAGQGRAVRARDMWEGGKREAFERTREKEVEDVGKERWRRRSRWRWKERWR